MPRKRPNRGAENPGKTTMDVALEVLGDASAPGVFDDARGEIVEDLGNPADPSNLGEAPITQLPPAPPHAVPGPILTRYESRIQIIDAYQYHGTVADAPDWVDRNWIGYCDADELRGIDAGPCLRVPIAGAGTDSSDVVLCRDGDYVAQQSVQLSLGELPLIRVEVWNRDMFHKLFLGRDITVDQRTPSTYQPHPHLSNSDPAVPQPPFDRPPGDPTSNLENSPDSPGDAPDADGYVSQ